MRCRQSGTDDVSDAACIPTVSIVLTFSQLNLKVGVPWYGHV